MIQIKLIHLKLIFVREEKINQAFVTFSTIPNPLWTGFTSELLCFRHLMKK